MEGSAFITMVGRQPRRRRAEGPSSCHRSSSRCQRAVGPSLERRRVRSKRLPNLSVQQRIGLELTSIPRGLSSSSTSRKLRLKCAQIPRRIAPGGKAGAVGYQPQSRSPAVLRAIFLRGSTHHACHPFRVSQGRRSSVSLTLPGIFRITWPSGRSRDSCSKEPPSGPELYAC